jgi:hypothetical protein
MCIDVYTCMLTLHLPNANNIASIYSGAFYRFLDHELVPRTRFSVKMRTLMSCPDRSTQRTWRLRQPHLQGGVHVTGRGIRSHSLGCTSGDRGQLHCGEADEEQQRRRRGRPQDLLDSVGHTTLTMSYSAGANSLTCSNDKVVILAVSRG